MELSKYRRKMWEGFGCWGLRNIKEMRVRMETFVLSKWVKWLYEHGSKVCSTPEEANEAFGMGIVFGEFFRNVKDFRMEDLYMMEILYGEEIKC